VVTLLAVFYVKHLWHESMQERYNAGVKDGKEAVADEYANKAAQLRNNWAIDKGRLEYEAQQRINAAKADADKSRESARGLQRTLDQVRSIADRAGVSVGPGTSTAKAINLLADLLEQSNDRSRQYAEFADAAYEAGRTCEIQYDEMRNRVLEQTNERRANLRAGTESRNQ
jgi:hypothetical protein